MENDVFFLIFSIIFVLLCMVSVKNSLFIAIEGGPFLLVEMSGKLYRPCTVRSILKIMAIGQYKICFKYKKLKFILIGN